jgi:polyhydroxybutyrate depolymerase
VPSWASAAKQKRVEPATKKNTSKRVKLALRIALFVVGGLAVLVLAAYIRFSIADKTNGTLVSSGATRKYLLYVPKSYEKSRPTPLVISLHGAAGWPALQSDISRWNDLADKHGFLVVYPAGTTLLGDRGPRVWPMGANSTDLDVKFIADLIAKLEGDYNVDASRVYADGLSNGGGMAYALGCKLSNRIAAIGAVAAALAMPDKMCDDARPEPVIAFHGTADKMAPFLGGKSGDPVRPQQFPSIRDWIDDWAGRNQCKDEPIDTPVAASVHRISYVNCTRGSDVVLYTIEGGGHQWPGGQPLPRWWVGPQINDVNATRTMWDFFIRHPRVQR